MIIRKLCFTVLLATPMIASHALAETSALFVDATGKVGFGTETPKEAIDVVGKVPSRVQLSTFSKKGNKSSQVIQRRARGTLNAPSALLKKDIIGRFSFHGMLPKGKFSPVRAAITVQTAENWGNTSNGTNILFSTTKNGTNKMIPTLIIRHSGDVHIPQGILTQASSRTLKHDIKAIDPNEILKQVVNMPVATWRYNHGQSPALHLGPMAEDFYDTFQLGDSHRTLSPSDMSGVALAAIKGLNAILIEKEDEIEQLKTHNASLNARLDNLEKAVFSQHLVQR